MKAVAVFPGKPDSVHLRDVRKPLLDEIPDGRGVLRRMRIWRPRRAAVLGAGPVGLLAAMILRLRELEVCSFGLKKPRYLNADLLREIGGCYHSTRDTSLTEATGSGTWLLPNCNGGDGFRNS